MSTEGRAKLELQPFDGKGTALDARIYVRKLEAYAAVFRLTPAQTAQALKFSVKDSASRWYGTLEEAEDDRLDSWTNLKAVFEERFCRALTPAELSKLVSELRQGSDSVDEFYDRCHEVQYLEENGVPDEARSQYREVFQRIHDNGVALKFLHGLSRGIRETVTASSEATTLDDYLRSARRAESARQDAGGTKANILEAQGQDSAPCDSDDDDRDRDGEDSSVDAVRGRSSRGRGSSGSVPWRSGNNKSGPSNSNDRLGPDDAGNGRTKDGRIICRYCFKVGHTQKQCYKRQNDRVREPNSGGSGQHGGGFAVSGNGQGTNSGSSGQGQGNIFEFIGKQALQGYLQANGLYNTPQAQGQGGGNAAALGQDTGGGFGGGGGSLGFQGF